MRPSDEKAINRRRRDIHAPLAKDDPAAGPDDVVGILVPEDLAACDRDVVLLPGEQQAAVHPRPGQRREVVDRCKDVESRTVHLPKERNLTIETSFRDPVRSAWMLTYFQISVLACAWGSIR